MQEAEDGELCQGVWTLRCWGSLVQTHGHTGPGLGQPGDQRAGLGTLLKGVVRRACRGRSGMAP